MPTFFDNEKLNHLSAVIETLSKAARIENTMRVKQAKILKAVRYFPVVVSFATLKESRK